MVKYIVGGVIVVLSWIFAILMELQLIIPTLITVLVALVILLMVGIAKLKERRAARQLERALQAQAAEQAASARPDLQHEIAEMQAEFQKAVSALKTTKKGGKKALYALPWYAIIGPPGSGKSTALRNSGIQFPYLSASGGGVRGLGGTRNCDWWMTNEAVILDTAGRWTSEDEDHDEWLGFLDLVKRFRPKKPLNGMIAAVSVGDVGGAREDEIVALARRIRERIDEVQGRLGVSLPVYVLFTKCDLIPGFIETFGDMSKQERGQVWGFTAPLSKPIGPTQEYFAKGFDELHTMLSRRSIKRMGDERKVASRELIYGFPQQLDVMRHNLQEFVHHLFLENVFKETPRFRGVYFTSGTQEGRPIDRVMSAMAEAFGQPQVQLPAPQVESKSYFLRDLFLGIVFRDGDAAVLSPDQLRRRRRRTYLTAGLIFALALGISGLPALAWAMNRSFLNETEEVIDETQRAAGQPNRGPAPETELHALFAQAQQLDEYDSDGPPLHMQLGMYQDDVFPHVREYYLQQMHDRVIGPIFAADTLAMVSFGQRAQALGAPPDAEEMKQMYERLKVHLLLSEHGPLAEGLVEPSLDDDLDTYLVEELHRGWAQATGTERHEVAYRSMREQIRYYVAALHDEELAAGLRFERSEPAVLAVRTVFRTVGSYTVAVQGIISEIEPLNYDVRLASMVGQVQSLQARTYVRGAFTKRAWDDRVEDMLEEDAARFFGENWVLGNPPPESERAAERQREEQLAQLRATYFQMYVLEWERFLASMTTPTLTGPQDQMVMLTEYTSTEPPMIERLIRLLDLNVSLVPEQQAGNTPGEIAHRARQQALRRGSTALGRVTRIGGADARTLLGEADRRAENALSDRNLGPAAVTPAFVRRRFLPLIEFAPAPPRNAAPGASEMVRPVTRYQEQLQYMRDALNQEQQGSNLASFSERQVAAQTLTLAQIEEQPLRWRPWFRAVLLPPVQGAAFERPPEPILRPSVDMATLQAQSGGRPPTPGAVPGVLPGQPPVPTPTIAPGQAVPGQVIPGQPVPGQPVPGQPVPGQPAAGQPAAGQPAAGQPAAQPAPAAPAQPAPAPAQPAPAQPATQPAAPAQPAPRPRGGNEWWR